MIDPTALAAAMNLHIGAEAPADRRHVAHHDRVVLIGCVIELSRPTPSLPDVARRMDTSHSTVHALLREWQSWHWRIRHAWLQHGELSLAIARERKGAAA